MYFYRNERALAAAEFLGSLADLHQQSAAAVADAPAGAHGEGEGYERASTGSSKQNADREVALRVLRALAAPPKVARAKKGGRCGRAPPPLPLPPPPAAEEVEALTAEVARARHHAELATMMCPNPNPDPNPDPDPNPNPNPIPNPNPNPCACTCATRPSSRSRFARASTTPPVGRAPATLVGSTCCCRRSRRCWCERRASALVTARAAEANCPWAHCTIA